MKTKFSLIPVFALTAALSACGHGHDTEGPSPRSGRTQSGQWPPVDGTWSITGKTCNDAAAPVPEAKSVRIGGAGSSLVFIDLTEDDQAHQCKKAVGFLFMLISAAHGADGNLEKGSLQETAERTLCWHKNNGVRDKTPYSDQSTKIEGKPFEVTLQRTQVHHFTLTSPSSPFCEGQKTVIQFQQN